MTPRDIITLALKDAGVDGVGQTAAAEDLNDAFTKLNMMMSQWNKKRWLIYHLLDVSKVATGAQSYTIGTGGDFSVTRPDMIDSAFVRFLNTSGASQLDYPLEIIKTREEYNQIALKNLTTFPRAVFLDSDFPLGAVYVWPIPSSQYEIHLTVKASLPSFANLSDTVNLPPEYSEALLYNLAKRLRPAYQKPADPQINQLARAALETIKAANAQIPMLKMPSGLRGGNYNIYSDQVQ